MRILPTLRSLNVGKEEWSGVSLGFKVIDSNVMPTLPDGKLLERVVCCSVSSSLDGVTTMTITVELQNG